MFTQSRTATLMFIVMAPGTTSTGTATANAVIATATITSTITAPSTATQLGLHRGTSRTMTGITQKIATVSCVARVDLEGTESVSRCVAVVIAYFFDHGLEVSSG